MTSEEDTNDFESLDMCHCDICWEYMLDRDPKFLDCHHSFCFKCLEKIVKKEQISCPTCRRVTKVAGGDITVLVGNFQLRRMRDELSEKWHKTPEICQICMEAKTVNKCKECSHGLCEDCTIKHNDIKGYKNHTVSRFCPEHPDSFVVVLCKKCLKSLCRRCFPSHAEHEKYFENYESGVLALQTKLLEFKLNVTQKLYSLNSCKVTDSEVLLHVDHVKEYIKGQQENKETKAEAEELLVAIKGFQDEAEDVMEIYGEVECSWTLFSDELNQLLHATDQALLDSYSEMEKRTAEQLEKTWKRLGPLPDNISHLGGYQVMRPSVLSEVKWLKEAKVIQDVSATEGLQVSRPHEIVCHGEKSVLMVDKDLNSVIKISQSVIHLSVFHFDPKNGQVQSISAYGRNWYVLQTMCITEITNNDLDLTVLYKPKITAMHKLLVVHHKLFIIVNSADGKIMEYDCDKDATKELVTGLNTPSYISMGHAADGPIFVVSIKGDRNVHIYNHHWRLQYIVGIPGGPMANLVVPEGILVADYDNHRVSHFTQSGKFICHLVKHGIRYPVGIAFNPPFLWVLERCTDLSHFCLKQYRVIR